jgi:hypothetical protein
MYMTHPDITAVRLIQSAKVVRTAADQLYLYVINFVNILIIQTSCLLSSDDNQALYVHVLWAYIQVLIERGCLHIAVCIR